MNKEIFIDNIKRLVVYWSQLENKTDFEKCSGVAFSILSMIDSYDIQLFQDGRLINDCELHEEFSK